MPRRHKNSTCWEAGDTSCTSTVGVLLHKDCHKPNALFWLLKSSKTGGESGPIGSSFLVESKCLLENLWSVPALKTTNQNNWRGNHLPVLWPLDVGCPQPPVLPIRAARHPLPQLKRGRRTWWQLPTQELVYFTGQVILSTCMHHFKKADRQNLSYDKPLLWRYKKKKMWAEHFFWCRFPVVCKGNGLVK